jgi:hypothetical protein
LQTKLFFIASAYPFHAKATKNVGPPIGELLGNHHVHKYIGEEIKAKNAKQIGNHVSTLEKNKGKKLLNKSETM